MFFVCKCLWCVLMHVATPTNAFSRGQRMAFNVLFCHFGLTLLR